jgi:hypothetical protein
MNFKGSEVDAFLKAHNGGENLLENFLTEPSNDSANSSQIEVCSLKYPYKEFAWLFARIIGQESTTCCSKICFVCSTSLCSQRCHV